MFLRNRIAAPQGQSQTINPSPQESGGLGALNQTQQPSPPQYTLPDGYSNTAPQDRMYTAVPPRVEYDYAYGPGGDRIEVPMPSPTPGTPLGETNPNALTNFFLEMRTPSATASYERWKSQQEQFGGSPTNPFGGMPMPSPTPGMPLGETNPNAPSNPFPNLPGTPMPMPPSGIGFMPLPGGDGQYPRGDFEPKNPFGGSPTNPFPGLPGTPMPRSEIGFMPPSRNPFDTSEQAYRYHIETAKYPPGGVPSYEQWKSGRENRPNPFPGLPGTPMPRSEIGFMPPSRNPFDTSEQAYRYHIETAKYPPGGVPSYEQWKSGRENRPNPFPGGLGSLLNRKFGSRR